MSICSIEGCLRNKHASGLCRPHHRAANRDKINRQKREARARNPEKYRASAKAWRSKNSESHGRVRRKNYEARKDTLLARKRESYQANKEKYIQRVSCWREANREKARESSRNWGKKNHSLKIANNNKRKADKLKATPPWADLNKIAEIYANCPPGYHVDHDIPLRGKNVCGLHVEDNLKYLPAIENLKKGNKFG